MLEREIAQLVYALYGLTAEEIKLVEEIAKEMKRIRLTKHAKEQSAERGATEAEVKAAIQKGSREPAKHGREMCRYNFPYGRAWQGKVISHQAGRSRHHGGSERDSCHYSLHVLLLTETRQ